MTENNDILKATNLRQMVAEYEKEQQSLCEKRTKNEQHRREYMEDVALLEFDRIRERELERAEEPEYFTLIQETHYAPHFRSLITGYTDHVYDNALASLQRKYAVVYDKDNLDKYPEATPLPRMQDIMDQYMPVWMTYEKLKALAAHCVRWRQK